MNRYRCRICGHGVKFINDNRPDACSKRFGAPLAGARASDR
jgi:hypothetical protein